MYTTDIICKKNNMVRQRISVDIQYIQQYYKIGSDGDDFISDTSKCLRGRNSHQSPIGGTMKSAAGTRHSNGNRYCLHRRAAKCITTTNNLTIASHPEWTQQVYAKYFNTYCSSRDYKTWVMPGCREQLQKVNNPLKTWSRINELNATFFARFLACSSANNLILTHFSLDFGITHHLQW